MTGGALLQVDLNDIKVVKKLGGNVEDTETVDGLVFSQSASHAAGGPTRIEKAKIALIQYQLSAPKTNVLHPSLWFQAVFSLDFLLLSLTLCVCV